MMTSLVTGGAGFIGSHIVEELIRKGQKVRVVDNFLTGKKENLEPFLAEIELIEGDIRDFETCRLALRAIDLVFHQAALPSVPRSIEQPELAHEINVTGTLNLLRAAVDARVKSFVFASSSSIYGDDPQLPKKEGNEGKPLSPYGASKFAGEKYCQVFSEVFGLPVVSLRYFNVFGPRQDPFSQYAAVIPNFITRILGGEKPVIYGDGEQSRDFTYVANVVEANLRAVESLPEVSGGVFNVACGEKTTVNDLARQVNAIFGTLLNPVYEEPRPGDIKHSYADVSLARERLKYEPIVSFREGLERTVAWYRERS